MRSAVTVSDTSGERVPSVAALAMLVTSPASMSAWVTA